MTLTAMTTGIKTGESSEPPETLEGSGKNYEEAWRDITQRREASLVHCTDWVVEENAFQDLLDACLRDPEVTYAAKVYLLQDQTVSDFLDAFAEEETGPVPGRSGPGHGGCRSDAAGVFRAVGGGEKL